MKTMKKMKQYEMIELEIRSDEPAKEQVSVNLEAVFQNSEAGQIVVKGFYVGNQCYKVRFYPSHQGNWTYELRGEVLRQNGDKCSEQKMNQYSGEFVCEENPKKHGIVHPDATHFRYEDDSFYYPFGTTVYGLVHQEQSLINQTMESLRQSPFNKIRICVFPKDFDYNKNDPEYYAFEKDEDGKWDVNRPCFEFWNRLEQRIAELDQMDIQCDLILFHPYDRWGFAKLTREEGLTYLDYTVRRLAAYPNIWWSLANEFDLMAYNKEDWECFADFIHSNDPYGHLLSNHHMMRAWDFNNKDTTHICVQVKDVDEMSRLISQYQKPLMVDECCYEGNLPYEWGNIAGFEMVNRFWKTCMQGGYCTHGETFLSDEDIIWWSKGGVLKGESPARIRFLRVLMESLPGPIDYNGFDLTKEMMEAMKANPPEEMAGSPMANLPDDITWEEIKNLFLPGKIFTGHCGEEVYLAYYGRHCVAEGELQLSESHSYDIEVIDVWEMTREKVQENVTGAVKVALPSKEGIAILATQIK